MLSEVEAWIRTQIMKTFYVYIVKCKDNSYYTGINNDIERRLQKHNYGEAPDSYTQLDDQ